MTAFANDLARTAGAALLTLLLVACGGGGTAPGAATTTQTVAAAESPSAPAAQVRRTTMAAVTPPAPLNADGPATRLTVRAHASLAGDVGAAMQLRVDDVVVGSAEVRATTPTDYTFTVPPMQPGARVDVVFSNDASINGADRNLYVGYVIAGDTYVLPTAPGVRYDRGVGAAAFDGVDVLAGQPTLGWNGALRITWPDPNMTGRVTVRASGTPAGGVGPTMQLRVDGITVGSTEVRSAHPADHAFAVPPLVPGSRIDVVYANDAVVQGEDRNLVVHYLIADTTYLLPTASGVTYDLGSGLAAFDGADVQAGQSQMHANGALRGRWPAANMTDVLTVRASGSLLGDVGPLMQVLVNGIVVGTTEVRSATPADHSFAVPPMQPGHQVDVAFTNDAAGGGADRNLRVAYLLSGTTVVMPGVEDTTYDRGAGAAAFDGNDVSPGQVSLTVNGALRTAWPAPNMTETLTVRARGSQAAGIGPVMDVMVDGVVVGSTEVRTTEMSDHHFAVKPVAAGSKVELVFTNDATIQGQDRNLFIDYAISQQTFLRPATAGVVYDRGAGASAFDNTDLLAGRGEMYWPGALRMTWPAPNITDTITVRASGTLAAGVGPTLQLRVDGVAVSQFEVRSTSPVDHQIAVPPLRVGSKIDVVFNNDAIVDGSDRNLSVAYLIARDTFVVPTASGVVYDRGVGMAAFDGVDVLPGRVTLGSNGALRLSWPAPNVTDTLTLRASGTLADNIGPVVQLRVNGVVVGTLEVRSTSPSDHAIAVPRLAAGDRIDVVYVNDGSANGQDRNLFVQYVRTSSSTLVPTAPGVVVDSGSGEAAFDGDSTVSGSGALYTNGALRLTVPEAPDTSTLAAQQEASRFLQQASFGPTEAELSRLGGMTLSAWLDEQLAMPARNDYVDEIQRKYDLGNDYRPKGSKYNTAWIGQRFWKNTATSPDQLRQRMALALHHIFMVSQVDSNLWSHTRAFARYLDTLNKHAFGNYRTLLEEVALSPAMGVYLSHMRNRKEDAASGRLPDENFAREVMQLFTIGLHELNIDGTPVLDAQGRPVETYGNDDVMALAKVFTGYSWAFPDNQLTEHTFRYISPDYSVGNDLRIDLQRMKPYPGQHSQAEKRLFSGRANAVVIPADSSAQDSVRMALDALFAHPNVGPFVGRQLIQRLVTSNPSPAYVARVAARFNNNGSGVRGDLAAVLRAVLLDSEARGSNAGKLREPVLRVAHWMRAFNATSGSGDYMMAYELENQSQRAANALSVFGYFRPGYVPPNTSFAADGATVPEMQIVNESTTSNWVNMALSMTNSGVGWTGTAKDVTSTLASLTALSSAGNVDGLLQRIDLLLFAGGMSAGLKAELLEAVTTVTGNNSASHLNRARVALFLALASPEYMVQR